MSTNHTPYVLRAKHPEAVALWQKQDSEKLAEFSEKAKAFAKEMGVKFILTRDGFDGSFITGFVQPDRSKELPEGWRRESGNHDNVVPALRSKAGKAVAARLQRDFSCPAVPAPGLPDLMWGHGVMGVFRVEQLGEHWYAKLGFDPRHERRTIDTQLWEEIPLSAYYLALEGQKQEAGAGE